MTESQITPDILIALNDPDLVVWRNNIGMAWMKNGQPVKFGVGGPGGADYIGVFRGRFIAIELKTPGGRQSADQRTHQQLVERKGGIYRILRSVDDAYAFLAELRGMP